MRVNDGKPDVGDKDYKAAPEIPEGFEGIKLERGVLWRVIKTLYDFDKIITDEGTKGSGSAIYVHKGTRKDPVKVHQMADALAFLSDLPNIANSMETLLEIMEGGKDEN